MDSRYPPKKEPQKNTGLTIDLSEHLKMIQSPSQKGRQFKLDLHNKKLTDDFILETVIPFLNENPFISMLDLSSDLTETPYSANEITSKIAPKLAEIPSLTEVNLKNDALGIEGSAFLRQSTSLITLNLSNNKMHSTIPLKSPITLLSTPPLKKLLAGCNLYEEILNDASTYSNLTKLDVNTNCIKELAPLKKLTDLTSLNLKGNQIKKEELKHLTGLAKLTKLNLSRNYSLSFESLQHLTLLTCLKLKNSKLDIGMIIYLSGLTNLTKLDLSDNFLPLSLESLQHLTLLTSLDLSKNQVDPQSFHHLSKFKNLTKLNLGNNTIKIFSSSKTKENFSGKEQNKLNVLRT